MIKYRKHFRERIRTSLSREADNSVNWFMRGTTHSIRRRRRRTGSTSVRFKPSQLVPPRSAPRGRLRAADIGVGGAVAIVALALVALIWIVTGRAIQDQGADIRERAEQTLTGQAATIAETVAHELQMIDQSLSIIQDAWKQDSGAVNLIQWQDKLPALMVVSDDLFICDEQHVIRQDIIPQAVGKGVGTAYATLPNGVLEVLEPDGSRNKDSLATQGQPGSPVETRQYLMYIIRGLDHPNGWLLGASYRSAELTRLFAQAALGFNAAVALVDTQHGIVQAVVGPAARQPNLDISKTPLYGMMTRSRSGVWLGPTGLDDVMRLHAFHRVGDRDATIVVAASWAAVIAPANMLATSARSLASAASALVFLVAGLLLWGLSAFRSYRRHERMYERHKIELERLRADEASSALQAQVAAARLGTIVANASDGIGLLDSSLRLTQWNFPFARGFDVALQQDMPLAALLREQLSRLDPTQVDPTMSDMDHEAEVARRVAVLCAGEAAGLKQSGPDGEDLILRGLSMETGGYVLLLNGFATWQAAPLPGPAVAFMAPAPMPIDW
jgi:PAS domain-containing protein